LPGHDVGAGWDDDVHGELHGDAGGCERGGDQQLGDGVGDDAVEYDGDVGDLDGVGDGDSFAVVDGGEVGESDVGDGGGSEDLVLVRGDQHRQCDSHVGRCERRVHCSVDG
jgi:hypothetical protein